MLSEERLGQLQGLKEEDRDLKLQLKKLTVRKFACNMVHEYTHSTVSSVVCMTMSVLNVDCTGRLPKASGY